MRPLGLPRSNYRLIMDQIKGWTDDGYFVNFFCDNPKSADRLHDILADRGFTCNPDGSEHRQHQRGIYQRNAQIHYTL